MPAQLLGQVRSRRQGSRGHFLGHRMVVHCKLAKVDPVPPRANIAKDKNTKPSKLVAASS